MLLRQHRPERRLRDRRVRTEIPPMLIHAVLALGIRIPLVGASATAQLRALVDIPRSDLAVLDLSVEVRMRLGRLVDMCALTHNVMFLSI